jgi:hypothetical protein
LVLEKTLEREAAHIVSVAFEKAWGFVSSDPELAHIDVALLRARLSHHLRVLASEGERDVWELANSAIFKLRDERSRLAYRFAA